jgi:methenyltetrahydrofolate cyclohydrolase
VTALDAFQVALEDNGGWLGAGAGAGLVVSLAASLVEQIARSSSESWSESGGAIAQATALRRRGLRLSRVDAAAYADARRALVEAAGRESADEGGVPGLSEALAQAAELPLQIAGAATDAATLAALAAERADPDLRADAAGAALLAVGAAETAAHLIEVNLSTRPADGRVTRANELVSLARAAGSRAVAASS